MLNGKDYNTLIVGREIFVMNRMLAPNKLKKNKKTGLVFKQDWFLLVYRYKQ